MDILLLALGTPLAVFIYISATFLLRWPTYKSLKVLEDKEKGENLETFITQIETYGTQRKDDFDKYCALPLAENLVLVSRLQQHKKASFFAVSA